MVLDGRYDSLLVNGKRLCIFLRIKAYILSQEAAQNRLHSECGEDCLCRALVQGLIFLIVCLVLKS